MRYCGCIYVVGTAITGTLVSNLLYSAKKDKTSSGDFSLLWIMIASAPASMNALARFKASSSPYPDPAPRWRE